MKYEFIVIITNILVNDKTFQTNIAMNSLYDTRLCGSNTVIGIIRRNVSLKCFFEIYLNVC